MAHPTFDLGGGSQRIIHEGQVTGFSGEPALDGGVLLMYLNLPHASAGQLNRYAWDDLMLRLNLRRGGFVATAEVLRPEDPVQTDLNRRLCARFHLSTLLLHRLEEARDPKGDLILGLSVDAQFYERQGLGDAKSVLGSTVRASTGVRLRVSASEWNEILGAMKWSRRVSFEVPIEGVDVPKRYRAAAGRLEEAYRKLRSGDWSGAVVSSRKMHEALAEPWPESGAPRKEWPSDARSSWSVATRIEHLRQSAKFATHPDAHHEQDDATKEEARLAVEVAGALLRYALRSK